MLKLPPLPYANDALAPHMSAETLDYHHGKHHKAYIDKLNELTDGTAMAKMSLEEIIAETKDAGDADTQKIFNNAAQSWNHEFFWSSLNPDGGGKPDGELMEMFSTSFGTFAEFKDQFKTAATGHFGSGWAWIVADGETLKIMTTHDADLPMAHGKEALLTCDLWEHAYYLDYQNARPKFIDAFLGHLANWDFMAENLAATRVAA